MKRRKFLIGSGALAAAGSAALGTGAFSGVAATRSVSIEVAADPNGYLGLRPLDGEDGRPETDNGSMYVELDDDGALVIEIGDNQNGGEGVNTDARTMFDSLFEICNQGTDDACVSWTVGPNFEKRDEAELIVYHEGSTTGGSSTDRVELDRGEPIPIGVGECATIGMGAETFGVDADADGALVRGDLTFTADTEGDCLAQSPGSGSTATEATISIPDQTTAGSTVEIPSVTLPEGGYISIHDVGRFGTTSLGNQAPDGLIFGSIIGISDLLAPGTHENAEVELFSDFATFDQLDELNDGEELARTQPLLAIPHKNTFHTGTGFREDPTDPGSQLHRQESGDGAYRNGPKTVGTLPIVNDTAVVEVEGSSSQERQEAVSLEAEFRAGNVTPPAADIRILDQISDGSSVTVDEVELPQAGYISIHDAGRFGATPLGNESPKRPILGSIVGISDLLPEGTHRDIEVDLYNDFATFEQLDELNDGEEFVQSQPLLAIPHRNTDETGTGFREDTDSPGNQLSPDESGDGAFFDGRKEVRSLPICNDIALVRLSGDDPANVDEAKQVKGSILDGDIQPP